MPVRPVDLSQLLGAYEQLGAANRFQVQLEERKAERRRIEREKEKAQRNNQITTALSMAGAAAGFAAAGPPGAMFGLQAGKMVGGLVAGDEVDIAQAASVGLQAYGLHQAGAQAAAEQAAVERYGEMRDSNEAARFNISGEGGPESYRMQDPMSFAAAAAKGAPQPMKVLQTLALMKSLEPPGVRETRYGPGGERIETQGGLTVSVQQPQPAQNEKYNPETNRMELWTGKHLDRSRELSPAETAARRAPEAEKSMLAFLNEEPNRNLDIASAMSAWERGPGKELRPYLDPNDLKMMGAVRSAELAKDAKPIVNAARNLYGAPSGDVPWSQKAETIANLMATEPFRNADDKQRDTMQRMLERADQRASQEAEGEKGRSARAKQGELNRDLRFAISKIGGERAAAAREAGEEGYLNRVADGGKGGGLTEKGVAVYKGLAEIRAGKDPDVAVLHPQITRESTYLALTGSEVQNALKLPGLTETHVPAIVAELKNTYPDLDEKGVADTVAKRIQARASGKPVEPPAAPGEEPAESERQNRVIEEPPASNARRGTPIEAQVRAEVRRAGTLFGARDPVGGEVRSELASLAEGRRTGEIKEAEVVKQLGRLAGPNREIGMAAWNDLLKEYGFPYTVHLGKLGTLTFKKAA